MVYRLRADNFAQLLQVVRQSVQTSHPTAPRENRRIRAPVRAWLRPRRTAREKFRGPADCTLRAAVPDGRWRGRSHREKAVARDVDAQPGELRHRLAAVRLDLAGNINLVVAPVSAERPSGLGTAEVEAQAAVGEQVFGQPAHSDSRRGEKRVACAFEREMHDPPLPARQPETTRTRPDQECCVHQRKGGIC